MFLADAEQCSIPPRVAERASRIGYRLMSYITWRKHGFSPEPVRSRVTRQAEYILHLSLGLDAAPVPKGEVAEARRPSSADRTSSSSRGADHRRLDRCRSPRARTVTAPSSRSRCPGRCIALSSREGDVILDPFLGSGTTALAARQLGRRCVGFDISDRYVELAHTRLTEATAQGSPRGKAANGSADQLQTPGSSPPTASLST